MSLSKLFQILVPLYANVRRPEAVLYKGMCNKSRLRVLRAWIPERFGTCQQLAGGERGWVGILNLGSEMR